MNQLLIGILIFLLLFSLAYIITLCILTGKDHKYYCKFFTVEKGKVFFLKWQNKIFRAGEWVLNIPALNVFYASIDLSRKYVLTAKFTGGNLFLTEDKSFYEGEFEVVYTPGKTDQEIKKLCDQMYVTGFWKWFDEDNLQSKVQEMLEGRLIDIIRYEASSKTDVEVPGEGIEKLVIVMLEKFGLEFQELKITNIKKVGKRGE